MQYLRAILDQSGAGLPKTIGLSLHVGLNNVDIDHYGNVSVLRGCINDANAMSDLARGQGFEVTGVLLDGMGTREAVKSGISAAAQRLHAGDIFFFTYSGHGSNLKDQDNLDEDGFDETWCLYDGMLFDDEANALWCKFQPGVRVLVLLDSCHSGTATRDTGEPRRKPDKGTWLARKLPSGKSIDVYRRNKPFYDDIIRSMAGAEAIQPQCSVRLISGCQDEEVSLDGEVNGLFTENLLAVWNGSNFTGSYADFHGEIVSWITMGADQTPNFQFEGTPNPVFDAQKPFTI